MTEAAQNPAATSSGGVVGPDVVADNVVAPAVRLMEQVLLAEQGGTDRAVRVRFVSDLAAPSGADEDALLSHWVGDADHD